MKKVIADIQKNTREILRVELDEFGGRQIISARTWYRDSIGALRPTPKGLSVDVRLLRELRAALTEAETVALDAGLIPQEGVR